MKLLIRSRLVFQVFLIWILGTSTTTFSKTATVEARAVNAAESQPPILDSAVEELEVGMSPDEKALFENDVHELEHAIEDEIVHKAQEISAGHLEEVSPEKLDKEVTEHNEKKPWYVRLGRYLKKSLHNFVQHTAKRVVNDVLIPAITNKIFGSV